MRLVLPIPPSANIYWRMFRGRIVKSKKARDYQASVAKMVLAELGAKRKLPAFDGDVTVSLVVYRAARRGDLDNFLKVTLDSLRGTVFADDDQVLRIVADRDDSKERPRVEIMIEPRHRPGQQESVFDIIDAPAPRPEPPHVRPKVVSERPLLTKQQLGLKAKSGTISFRGSDK